MNWRMAREKLSSLLLLLLLCFSACHRYRQQRSIGETIICWATLEVLMTVRPLNMLLICLLLIECCTCVWECLSVLRIILRRSDILIRKDLWILNVSRVISVEVIAVAAAGVDIRLRPTAWGVEEEEIRGYLLRKHSIEVSRNVGCIVVSEVVLRGNLASVGGADSLFYLRVRRRKVQIATRVV